ncbi:glycoside hydrolase family 1 protein [Listeria monocytogenes]|nr:glycoside hydrolase family 1 protein [Listeria monocytogenes]
MNNNFLWGGATASYQCEGAWDMDGKSESMWDYYLHEAGLENGDVASDHYHRYEEDIRMMKEGGQNSYRFSLSWPRIIKNRQGDINLKGIEFYQNLLDTCKKYDIEPFVTLYHWDLPQYWEETGGWLDHDVCAAFEHYAKVCYDHFGDKITNWTTFNEPKWFVANGYKIGNYPPGYQDTQKTMIAAYNVMYASALGVKAFKEGGYPGQIGIVHSYTPVNGVDESIETKIAMRYADNYCNNWILDTAALGEFPVDLIAELAKSHDISFMKTDELQTIKQNTVDFIGLNYYSRTLVKPYTGGETQLQFNHSGKKGESKVLIKNWFEQVKDPANETTEWDTEIYPKGLQDGLIEAYERYQLPLYVTENGIGVREDVSVPQVDDAYRIAFMDDHINAIFNAIDAGCDIRGYYAWSPFDLYSWKNGVEKRYGLVAVDFENNQIRKPKASYYWFKEMIESQGKLIKRREF